MQQGYHDLCFSCGAVSCNIMLHMMSISFPHKLANFCIFVHLARISRHHKPLSRLLTFHFRRLSLRPERTVWLPHVSVHTVHRWLRRLLLRRCVRNNYDACNLLWFRIYIDTTVWLLTSQVKFSYTQGRLLGLWDTENERICTSFDTDSYSVMNIFATCSCLIVRELCGLVAVKADATS